jgi:glycosyltransferase involved in cell wall biosynthesis
LVSASDYLGDYYGAMDAFVMLSEHEGFGLVVPEAMLCNCPVIATNVGCVPEVIQHNVSGIVVPPDVDTITNSLRRLSDHPAWAKAMAAEAHRFADQHLHAARMAREYEQLLCQLADRLDESTP